MINWDFRNRVLKAVYELDGMSPGSHHIQEHFGQPGPPLEEIDHALTWLANQGLLDPLSRSWGGPVIRVDISALGSNYVETDTSVEELAKAAVRGSINNAQYNYNHAPSTNVMGDHNTITQNNQFDETFEKILAALREANEVEKADELQQEAKQNGILAAIQKAATWIGQKVFSDATVAQIAPLVFAALTD